MNAPPSTRAPVPARAILAAVAALVLSALAPAQVGGNRGRLFSLPRSQDHIYEWRQARADLEEGRTETAIERLHRLLQVDGRGVVPVDENGERFAGLRCAVLMTLRDLEEPGKSAYEKLIRREAGSLLRTAFEHRRPEQLAAVADDFPASDAGRRARMLLCDLALEDGRGLEAAGHARALLDALPTADAAGRAAVEQRIRAARILAGTATPRTRDADVVSMDKAIASAMPAGATDGRGWQSYGGGDDEARSMRAPLGRPAQRWEHSLRAPGFRAPYPMHAIGDARGILVNDGRSLHCLDPLGREVLWSFEGPLHRLNPNTDEARDYSQSINRDLVLTAACNEDVVVAGLQVPSPGQTHTFRSIHVTFRIPQRRLFAFERATGKLLWSHWDEIDGAVAERFTGHEVAGPPLICGNRLYVASHDQTGAIAYYLTAYDLDTGTPLWRQLVCSSQGEVNMFGNSRREYAASALTMADGVLLGFTNLGVAFAADANDGRLRWITAYDVVQMPQSRLTDQRDRTVYFGNNPLVVTDGVVACAPLDSASALGLDVATGEVLWHLHHRAPAPSANDVYWLLGAIEDEFIFAGQGVVAVKARPSTVRRGRVARQVMSPSRLGTIGRYGERTPRGAVAGDTIYHVTNNGVLAFNRRGDGDPRPLLAGTGLGNLLLVDGIAVSVRDGSLQVFYDIEKLVQDAEREAMRKDADPASILRLAGLLRASSAAGTSSTRDERAERLYRRGIEAARRGGLGPASPVYRQLASELFKLTRDRAQRMHATAPAAATQLMRTARDGALVADEWLEAQETIIEWIGPRSSQFGDELELMVRTHGSVEFAFDRAGRMPAAAWVLWQRAQHEAPPAAMIACQDLVDRYPDIRINGDRAGSLALRHQGELIAEHGRNAYAPVEERAVKTLASASGDARLLRGVARRFPHSDAACSAVRSALDLAVREGDLGAAATAYAVASAAGIDDPGLARRMLLAADAGGNAPLAVALARSLVKAHERTVSDLPADDGATYASVLGKWLAAADAETRPRAEVARPLRVLRDLTSARGESLRLCSVQIGQGFAPPSERMLYLAWRGERVAGYDAERGATMLEKPLFTTPFQYQAGQDFVLCGPALIMPSLDEVCAVHARTGAPLWKRTAQAGRMLVTLGCQGGVLHVFSERRRGDSGLLIGIEPLSGTVLFEQPFSDDFESNPPVSSAGHLWIFDPGSRERGAEIRQLDPLSGAVSAHVPLSRTLLRDLGLEDDDRRAFAAQPLHQAIFADDAGIYIPVDGDDRTRPRLAALTLDGRVRWLWRGIVGRDFEMCAAATSGRIVIVERGPRGGRLLVLDRDSSAIRKESVLGPGADVLNWSRTERSTAAPNAVLLSDGGSRDLRLLCFSLDESVPSFAHRLGMAHDSIIRSPVIGEDFIAIPAQRRSNRKLDLFVLDLARRRTLLEGDANVLSLPYRQRFRMQAVGGQVVVQTGDGIAILGEESQPK